jgi:prepilin-type processing-associated H-X9-DG protein
MKRHIVFRRPRRAGVALADLLVVAALIPVAGMLIIGCYRHHGDGSCRVKCASNLRQIGQALLIYSNDAKGPYPRSTYVPGETVTPTWGTQIEPNDVSAALYLLLRTQDITAEVFICPSSNAERWDFGRAPRNVMSWSNWDGREGVRKHLSYSYANPYPDDDAAKLGYKLNNSLGAEFAVAADINPGTTGDGGQNVLAVTSTSSARDMQRANSANHDRDGQNVLYGDGHVEFQTNPFCGVQRDMIYARRAGASGFASSAVVDSPYDANDSVLLPTDD